jgi:hypothetical protein
MKKEVKTAEYAKKLVASIDKETQQPRLAESVREPGENPTPPNLQATCLWLRTTEPEGEHHLRR